VKVGICGGSLSFEFKQTKNKRDLAYAQTAYASSLTKSFPRNTGKADNNFENVQKEEVYTAQSEVYEFIPRS
jgi:hypothetical protein